LCRRELSVFARGFSVWCRARLPSRPRPMPAPAVAPATRPVWRRRRSSSPAARSRICASRLPPPTWPTCAPTPAPTSPPPSTNGGPHHNGRAGSFRPVDESKPALTLNFDKFQKHQNFHGIDKLALNNSVQDSSYMTEAICSELFLAAGVPTPRTTHARVELNG